MGTLDNNLVIMRVNFADDVLCPMIIRAKTSCLLLYVKAVIFLLESLYGTW